MTYRGHIKNGVVVLDKSLSLPEGAEVEVVLPATTRKRKPKGKAPSLYERLKPVIGKAKGLPPDASLNHDHYLYGLPKR
jgi:hypothetical protein